MIRIGPAGIPLSCKGRTIKDGIIYTRNLELDAMQVQFVRGIRTTEEEALEIGRVAREAAVEVHVHAPYYTNLAGDDQNVEMAIEKIVAAGHLSDAMGAKTLAVHPGLYHPDGPQATRERVLRSLGLIQDAFKENGTKVTLALECAGKAALFGTLEETIEVCEQTKGVIPILDFAHIHARGNGSLLAQEDFEEVFDKVKALGLDWHLLHFTGILYENGNERHHLPIKKGDLRFEPLVEAILDHDHDVTIISHSPILEHDAMYMKIVLDRVREKRELKRQREEAQKQAEEDRERQRKEREKAAAQEAKQAEKAAKASKPKKAPAKKKTPTKKAAKKPNKKASAKKPAKKAGKKKPSTKKAAKKKPAKKAAKKKAAKKKTTKRKAAGKKKTSKKKKS